MLSLDRQFKEMEAERDSLKAENLDLKAQVNPLQREVDGLKRRIEDAQKKSGGHPLDDIEVKLLVELTKVFAAQLAEHLAPKVNVSTTKAEYFLGHLSKNDYLLASYDARGNTRYALGYKGREYLVTHNLV